MLQTNQIQIKQRQLLTYPDSYAGDFTYSGMPSQLDVRIPDGQLFECPVEVALALHHEQERDDLFYVPGFLEAR